MNRRNFMEAATKSMACAGTAMFLMGKGMLGLTWDKAVQRRVNEGDYEVWWWRVSSESSDHSWNELRDSIEYPNGEVFTRTFGETGEFTKTTVIPNCYPTIRYTFKPPGRHVVKSPIWA